MSRNISFSSQRNDDETMEDNEAFSFGTLADQSIQQAGQFVRETRGSIESFITKSAASIWQDLTPLLSGFDKSTTKSGIRRKNRDVTPSHIAEQSLLVALEDLLLWTNPQKSATVVAVITCMHLISKVLGLGILSIFFLFEAMYLALAVLYHQTAIQYPFEFNPDKLPVTWAIEQPSRAAVRLMIFWSERLVVKSQSPAIMAETMAVLLTISLLNVFLDAATMTFGFSLLSFIIALPFEQNKRAIEKFGWDTFGAPIYYPFDVLLKETSRKPGRAPPLVVAIMAGKHQSVRKLLGSGNVDVTEFYRGLTPLMWAIRAVKPEIAVTILDFIVDSFPDPPPFLDTVSQDNMRLTALILAITCACLPNPTDEQEKMSQVVVKLLNAGANPNVSFYRPKMVKASDTTGTKDEQGDGTVKTWAGGSTALYLVTAAHKVNLANLLLQHGAVPSIEDYEHAKEVGCNEIQVLVEQYLS